jgi:hypothetical protein
MTNLRQAAQQALEALEHSLPFHETVERLEAHNKAITALRAALSEEALQRLTDVQQEMEDSLAEPVAWMPIGSAPKGRIVLVYYKNSLGNGRTMRARYYLPETLDSDTTESGWADEGWYEESEAYEYLMPLDHEPKHWMPLPPAPGIDHPPRNTEQEPVVDCPRCGHCCPQQHAEPVAWMSPSKERLEFSTKSTVYGSHTIPLYTAPPKRLPLTEEEIGEVAIKSQDGISPHDDTLRFARAIEAAHGIKGEA